MSSTMLKQASHALSSLSSGLQSRSGGRIRRNRRWNNHRRPQRFQHARRQPRPEGILAGYGSALTSSFYTAHSGDGCICRGLDLITNPIEQGYNISFFASANPVTWSGTRIAAVASGFQNYRPRKFIIHYRPQVGSTSELSVFIGTVWQSNSIYTRESIEPSLLTSPGGTYLPSWQSSTSVVPLGSNLPQRMFPIRDPSFEVVPFAVVARSSAGGISSDSVALPGRIFIEYEYEFRNAIGSRGNTFDATVVEESLASRPTTEVHSGWIIDYTDRQPSGSLPLFAHLTWDSVSATQSQPRIDGVLIDPPTSSPVTPLIYTQGSDER